MPVATRIFCRDERPFSNIEYAAVVITKFSFFHLGLIYRDPQSKKLRLLHLADNNQLNDDSLEDKEKYLWGIIDLPEKRVKDIAIRCLLVRDANREGLLPFEFTSPVGFFKRETGKMLLGPKKRGLTCATLVLAIFHMAKIPLIDYGTWSDRTDDKKFQRAYAFHLRSKGAPAAHVQGILSNIDGIRYRPSEVISSAVTPRPVCTMEKLAPLGLKVESMVESYISRIQKTLSVIDSEV